MPENTRDAAQSLMLTPEETASELRVSLSTVFELLKSGEIPSVLLGPHIRRIPRAGLAEYVDREMGQSSGRAGRPQEPLARPGLARQVHPEDVRKHGEAAIRLIRDLAPGESARWADLVNTAASMAEIDDPGQ